MNRNVVLLLDKKVQKYAISLSQQIANQYKTTFILDGKGFHPHITLYQASYPDRNEMLIGSILTNVSQASKQFSVQVRGVSTLWGFIFLDVLLDDHIKNIHAAVVSSLNELREGMIMEHTQALLSSPDVPEQMKESIRAYGSPLAMEAFHPHITLCRLTDVASAEAVCASLKNVTAEFQVNAIHVANIGMDGTVNEIFGSYQFLL